MDLKEGDIIQIMIIVMIMEVVGHQIMENIATMTIVTGIIVVQNTEIIEAETEIVKEIAQETEEIVAEMTEIVVTETERIVMEDKGIETL